jgi:hypothetical protein
MNFVMAADGIPALSGVAAIKSFRFIGGILSFLFHGYTTTTFVN